MTHRQNSHVKTAPTKYFNAAVLNLWSAAISLVVHEQRLKFKVPQ